LKLSRALFSIVFLFCFNQLFAQENLPKGYFMFPIKPGKPNYLAGNMGELRATHFHAGIDIKTEGREGLPVYAAADGYVSRIKVSTTGYGNALYLTHPNGFTTVYAHLLSFSKPIADYLIENQYRNESFEIELCPAENQFTFKKGEVIGLSGNSGSSGGPHLHFEIRDSLEQFLDPLLFGFTEIADRVPATIEKIAITTMDINSRVNGAFGRFEFKPVLQGKEYVINTPIEAKGVLGIELLAYDKADYTHNKYGISYLELKVDGKEVFNHNIQKMHFKDARSILIHTNFEESQKSGKRYQKLYVDDGNNINIYHATNNGKINIGDTLEHHIEIKLWDVNQNQRKLTFKIKGNKNQPFKVEGKGSEASVAYYNVLENVVMVSCGSDNSKGGSLANFYIGHKTYELNPAYKIGNEFIYLWDLRSGLPDSVGLCTQTLQFGFSGMIPPGKEYNVSTRHADLRFSENTLFDTLFLDIKKINQMYKIQNPHVPLMDNIYLTLRPEGEIKYKDKTAVYAISPDNAYYYEGGSWNTDGSISFKTKYFSYFVIATDTIAPTIKFADKSHAGVKFLIDDQLSGIGNYSATLNGKWLLMNYDYKRKLLWSDQLDKAVPLKGKFELVVTDNAGNQKIIKATL